MGSVNTRADTGQGGRKVGAAEGKGGETRGGEGGRRGGEGIEYGVGRIGMGFLAHIRSGPWEGRALL